jgi:hypothetical protein
MFLEIAVPVNSIGGRERDDMDDDVTCAGMQPVQMIAGSKHY